MEQSYSTVVTLLFILTLDQTSFDIEAVNYDQLSGNCLFPNYLQTVCGKPHSVCRWSQGKRFTSREFGFASRWQGYRGHGEWNWVVSGGSAKVSSAPELKTSIERTYSCYKSKSKDTFLVSYQDSANQEAVSYACIQFVRRGLNVVQYKLSSFTVTANDTQCNEQHLIPSEDLLVANIYNELPDCPKFLQGGYKIVKIYNRLKDQTCLFNSTTPGILESDCLAKEGLYIGLGAGSNCSRSDLLNHNLYDVNLRCYSRQWKENGFTFFITTRRPRWRHEYESFEFQCIRIVTENFNSTNNSSTQLIKIYMFSDPYCPQSETPVRSESGLSRDYFILYLQRESISEKSYEPGCTFPKELSGKWIEKSQFGRQEIEVERTAITIPPYGKFMCKQRYTFNYENPHECVNRGSGGQWMGESRVRFYFDDFIVTSDFTNGCRRRVTRLGLTETLQEKALAYRLSQSEPVVSSWSSPEEYYRIELLKRFCSALYIFERDPYPYWGRNIEKILLRLPLTRLPETQCSLLDEKEIMYNFRSIYSDETQSTCSGKNSWIEIGCKVGEEADNSSTPRISVRYDPANCSQQDTSYYCLGKLRRFGEFFLIQNTKNEAVYCASYDRENKQILRMSSPQCSDVDWGAGYSPGNNYFERFDLHYPSRCPVRTNPNNRNRNTRVPPKKKENSAARLSSCSFIIVLLLVLPRIVLAFF